MVFGLPATNDGLPNEVATDRTAATVAVIRADSHGKPRNDSAVYVTPAVTPNTATNV
ncbi:hypothetical protein [Cutibacterium phage FD1]|nr:hypothetical protein [Cutibacterium phage FD1]QPB11869.1 hypothetical protein [Cutibacterium phage PAVL45]